jgi:hypothetical protein
MEAKRSPIVRSHLPPNGFRDYNPSMPGDNPLGSPFPRKVHPVNDGEATVSEYIEKREGEVALDTYVRAQTSAPEVVKRISELENCLWRVADAISTAVDLDAHPELRSAVEAAQVLLRNRLEVDETKHRFHSELGAFKDDLRLTKD